MEEITDFKLENLILDTDFRGEQYFIRVYCQYPQQNTQNNIKALKKQIEEGIRTLSELKKFDYKDVEELLKTLVESRQEEIRENLAKKQCHTDKIKFAEELSELRLSIRDYIKELRATETDTNSFFVADKLQTLLNNIPQKESRNEL